jgi:pseudouridine-5'-phosphate glycosidase
MPVGKDILDIGIGIEFSSLIQEYIPVFACRTIELPQPFYRESFASMNRTILHTGEVIVDKDLASLSIDAYIVLLTLWMLQINATEQKIH